MNYPEKQIWIIEDDPATAYLHQLLVKDTGFGGTVQTYSVAETALASLERQPRELPQLIILDLTLPGISGWQFLDRLAQWTFGSAPRPRVLIVSNEVQPAHAQLIKAYSDAVGIYEKPLTAEKLAAVMERILVIK